MFLDTLSPVSVKFGEVVGPQGAPSGLDKKQRALGQTLKVIA